MSSEIMNESGIHPCGHRLLILPQQVEEVSKGGIVLHTASTGKLEALAQTFGIVIEVGETAFNDQPSPWCIVGDRVSFAKYSGLINKGIDGKEYRIINDLDIVSRVADGVK